LACVKSKDQFLFKRNESEPCIKIAVSSEDQISPEIIIYPNPVVANQEIKIKNIPHGSVFEIYNTVGQVVFRNVLLFSGTSLIIDLKPGVYIYRVLDNHNYLLSGKLVVY
jgi:hypothetical protein